MDAHEAIAAELVRVLNAAALSLPIRAERKLMVRDRLEELGNNVHATVLVGHRKRIRADRGSDNRELGVKIHLLAKLRDTATTEDALDERDQARADELSVLVSEIESTLTRYQCQVTGAWRTGMIEVGYGDDLPVFEVAQMQSARVWKTVINCTFTKSEVL